MKRYDFEQAVYESELDAPSKQILIYYAYKKHWNNDGQAWPSAATVAKDTRLSAITVKRRTPLLREAGWLVDTGQRVGNGAIVYDLAIGTSISETPVTESQDETTTDNQYLSDTSTSISESTTSICETPTSIREIHKEVINKIEEVKEEVTTVPDGPVETTSNSLLEEKEGLPSIPPKFRRIEIVDAHAISMRYSSDLDSKTKQRILDLALTPNFMSEEGSASIRVNAAIQEVLREETP